jgi:hypothetical protein
VYEARLHGGERVAVKVQRPEAQRRVEADLALMRDFAALLDARFGDRIFIDVKELVAEFEGVKGASSTTRRKLKTRGASPLWHGRLYEPR